MGNPPNIRFKGFTDDWEQRKVSDVAKIIAGGTPSTKENSYWEPKEIPWLSSGEVHKKYITFTDDMISQIGMNNSSAKMVAKDSVLIALAGQGKTRGTVAINRIPLTTNQSIAAMTFNENFIPEFVFYNLENRYDELRRMSSGDGSRGGLNKQLVGDIEIPYTEKKEQERIGSFFESLDRIITLHQRKCDETKKLKKFMLQKMFPKKDAKKPEIRFVGFTNDWEQRKLMEVAEYRNGKAHENEINDDGEYIVVNSKFVSTNGEIRKFSYAQNEPLYENEIAFVLSDVPNGRAIARTFLVDKSGKYTLNQRIAGITPHEDTDPYYLYIKMNRNEYFLKFDDGNKQTNLSIKDVLNYEDMYPSYKEQQKIGMYFQQLDHIITLHQRKCDELKEFKKYMLQNMFPQKG